MTSPTLSIDFKGWHIWSNTQGRILANGPDPYNRLFDFDNVIKAINWLYLAGYKDVARHLHAQTKACPH